MKKFSFLLLITGIAQIGLGQVKLLADKKEVKTFCDGFMQKTLENKLAEGFQTVKQYSKIDPQTLDKLNDVMADQLSALEVYGKMMSYSLIEEKNVQESLLKMTYMLKFENSCLKFDFRFYNNGKGWQVNFLNFTEKIEEFFR